MLFYLFLSLALIGHYERSDRCETKVPRNAATLALRRSQLKERARISAAAKAKAKAKAKYFFRRPNQKVWNATGHHANNSMHKPEDDDDVQDTDARGSDE